MTSHAPQSPTTTPASGKPTLGFGIALGFLSALGPFAIDLYLPAMPEMAGALRGNENAVQRTLSAFFFGLAFAQIPIGALADRFGRRTPLIFGLALFILASFACSLATSLDQLVALRFVQGMGACAGTSSARAIIRDLHRGHHAARLMAFTFLIIGISPMLAPLLGSGLLQFVAWRGLFVILSGAGLLAAICVILFLPETLASENRAPDWSGLPRAFAALLGNGRFVGWAVVAGLATTVPFAFVTAAPFVYSGVYGLAPVWFSVLLAVNAGMSIVATQIAPHLLKRLGASRLALRAALGALAITAALGLASALLPGSVPLAGFQAFSVLLFMVAGLVLTPAATSALDSVREGIGAAAGLLGTIQLAVTALASAAVTLWPPVSLQPLTVVLGSAFTLMLVIVLAISHSAAPEQA